MKKNILITIALLIVGVIIYSCSQLNDESGQLETPVQKMKFEDFKKWGEIHNAFLTNMKDNFNPPQEITSYEEGIDYILQFNTSFLKTLDFTKSEISEMTNLLEKYKYMVDVDYSYNYIQNACYSSFMLRSGGEIKKIASMDDINDAYELNIIDDFERKSLLKLLDIAQDNYDGLVSCEEMLEALNLMKDDWEAQGYTEDGEYGRMFAYALSISLESTEWWIENYDEMLAELGEEGSGSGPAYIAPWVANDIAGGIIGGLGSGLNSWGNTGRVNWGETGRGAIVGAVAGSLGVVPGLGRWISNIFKL